MKHYILRLSNIACGDVDLPSERRFILTVKDAALDLFEMERLAWMAIMAKKPEGLVDPINSALTPIDVVDESLPVFASTEFFVIRKLN